MHGNPVEGFDAGKLGELVNEPGRKENLRSRAVRAVRAYEIKILAGRNDIGDPRPAYLDRFVAGEFLQRLVQEIRRATALPVRAGREWRASSDCAGGPHRRAILCGGTFPG